VCGDEKPDLGPGTYLVETTFFNTKTRFESVRPNERSPPVGQRAIDDSFRRRDVSGWASVYRKQVDENSDYPNRSSVHAMDKPSVKQRCGPMVAFIEPSRSFNGTKCQLAELSSQSSE
jgi:hypothetical protein